MNVGYQACCNTEFSRCLGDDGVCMCDHFCPLFADCCSDHGSICMGLPGSCAIAGYTSCCVTGDCFGSASCKCDGACRTRGDCCIDIGSTCCEYIREGRNGGEGIRGMGGMKRRGGRKQEEHD